MSDETTLYQSDPAFDDGEITPPTWESVQFGPAMSTLMQQRLDALAAQRDRLREALRIVAIIADMRGKQLSPYWPPVLCEEGQEEMGLLPGDLGDEA